MDDRSTQVCNREVRGARQVSSSSLRLRFVSGRLAVYVRFHLHLCCSALECTAPAVDEARPHRSVSGRSAARVRSYLLPLLRSARLACAPSWMTGPHRSVSERFAVHVRSHHRLCGSGLFQGGSRCTSGLICVFAGQACFREVRGVRQVSSAVFAAQRSSARRPPWMRYVHTGLCQGEARRTPGLICCLCRAALDWLVPRHG